MNTAGTEETVVSERKRFNEDAAYIYANQKCRTCHGRGYQEIQGARPTGGFYATEAKFCDCVYKTVSKIQKQSKG